MGSEGGLPEVSSRVSRLSTRQSTISWLTSSTVLTAILSSVFNSCSRSCSNHSYSLQEPTCSHKDMTSSLSHTHSGVESHHSCDLMDPALQSFSLVSSSRRYSEPQLTKHTAHQLLQYNEVRSTPRVTFTAHTHTLIPSSSDILLIILTHISLVRGN